MDGHGRAQLLDQTAQRAGQRQALFRGQALERVGRQSVLTLAALAGAAHVCLVTQALLSIIGVMWLCMLSPGPDMALVMRNTLRSGRASGAATALGVMTGNLVHIGYAALGLGWLVAHNQLVYDALRYTGSAYLIYLGVHCIRSALAPATVQVAPEHAGSSYRQGVINNLLNPKGALFYLGVFATLITPDTPMVQTLAMIAAMIITAAVFWVLFVWLLQLEQVRGAIARAARPVDAAFGILLISLALRVAVVR